MQIVGYVIKQIFLWGILYACSFLVAFGLLNAGLSAFILMTYLLLDHGITLFPAEHFFKLVVDNDTTTKYELTNEFISEGIRLQALLALVIVYLHHFFAFIKRRPYTKLSFWSSLKIYALIDFVLALLGVVFGILLALDGHAHPFSFAFYSLILLIPLLFLQAAGLFGFVLFDDIAEQEEKIVLPTSDGTPGKKQ